MQYHINPETGNPNICRTTGERGCKYAVKGVSPEHYGSKTEAMAAAEKHLGEHHEMFTTTKKTSLISPVLQASPKYAELHKMFPKNPIVLSESEITGHIEGMVEENAEIMNSLKKEEKYAIGYYSMSGSKDINGLLRKGSINSYYSKPIYVEGSEEYNHVTELVQNRVKVLDAVMKKHGSRVGVEPRVLYRYIKVPENEDVKDFAGSLIQDGVVKDDGFTSTTEDPSFLHSFLSHPTRKKEKYVVLEMLSSQGVSLQSEKQRRSSIQSLEAERLLPRGTEFLPAGGGMKTYGTGDDRVALLKYFGGYSIDPNYVPDAPKNKRLFTLQLVDRRLI